MGPELDPIHSIRKTQQHEAFIYCYVVVCCGGETEPPAENQGAQCIREFPQSSPKKKGPKVWQCWPTPNPQPVRL